MKFVVRMMHRFGIVGALLLFVAGCNGGGSTPEPAPNFALTDVNQSSATYGQDRQLSDVSGRVIIIHFVLYT